MDRLTPERFAERFTGLFHRSTFRLETLDFYVAVNEREPFERFRSGLPQDLGWRRPWARLVSTAKTAGKRMERVHIVTEPLTEYMAFEITCAYPSSVEAGEDVRVLPRSAALVSQLPNVDYWLFDSHRAALLHYDDGGNFIEAELTDDPETIVQCCHWRDVALHQAVPLAAYLAINPDLQAKAVRLGAA